MDQSSFIKLTGVTPKGAAASRFTTAVSVAQSKLESMLGWPLDPADWDNQYLETGKVRNADWFCSDAAIDPDNLDPADTPVGKTRLFPYSPTSPWLLIDPATAIHSVKLVRDNITYRTFETVEYAPAWKPGAVRYAQALGRNLCWYCGRSCFRTNHGRYQLAVDADWAFAPDGNKSKLPLELQQVWADMVAYDLNPKSNIKSENITSYSYTKFKDEDPFEANADIIAKYVGPNGRSKRASIV